MSSADCLVVVYSYAFIQWCELANVNVENFVVCIVDKMAQDAGMNESIMVLLQSSSVCFQWIHSYCACFHSENFVEVCFCCFYW